MQKFCNLFVFFTTANQKCNYCIEIPNDKWEYKLLDSHVYF